jgi:tripartite-type tricarboxylate transporter receptor subunit TctC
VTRPTIQRRDFLAALTVLAAAPHATLATAQTYPTRLVKIVCAHAPGGAADQLSRIVADKMTKPLGQSIIIENRPGASTMVAAELVASAPPDGYTLLMATVTTLSINPSLHSKIKYSPLKDFSPVSIVASTPFFMGVANEVPAHTGAELIALAKAKPGTLNYGSSGQGTSSHLAGELFNQMAGIDMVHVPYQATSTRNNDLASGVIQVVFGNDLQTLAKAGRLRIIGVTSLHRLSGYPDIPTVAESADLPGYEASVAPAGTPAPIVARLQQSVAAAVSLPDVKKQVMVAVGGDTVGSSPAEFARVIRDDMAKWDKVIKQAHINPED